MLDLSFYIAAFLLLFSTGPSLTDTDSLSGSGEVISAQQEDPYAVNFILNGRVWRNLHTRVRGHQFYLTDDYLKADINFNGRLFKDQKVKYDILNDELILSIDSHPVIIMNKEMVENFTLHYFSQDLYFFNAGTDTTSLLKGYINVLYDGPTALYVKQSKMIQPLAVEGRFDEFYEERKIFIKKDGEIIPVNTRRSLFESLSEREQELKSFIKRSKIKVTNKDPYSYIPVVKHFDDPGQ